VSPRISAGPSVPGVFRDVDEAVIHRAVELSGEICSRDLDASRRLVLHSAIGDPEVASGNDVNDVVAPERAELFRVTCCGIEFDVGAVAVPKNQVAVGPNLEAGNRAPGRATAAPGATLIVRVIDLSAGRSPQQSVTVADDANLRAGPVRGQRTA